MIHRFILALERNPWAILKDTSVTTNSDIVSPLASISGIIMIIGIGGAAITLMAQIIITVMSSKKVEKFAELKDVLGAKLFLVAALSGATSICAAAKMFFDNLL